MNKKAQGMSIRVIIIAAIGLIILLILFALVSGRIRIFGGGLDDQHQSVVDCVCQKVGVRNCGETAEYTVEDNSCPQWIDCPNNCYKK